MTNHDLHNLYSIAGYFTEITFSKSFHHKGLGIYIDDKEHSQARENRQVITDTLYSLNLEVVTYLLGNYESFSLYKCQDDSALKFTLTLHAGDCTLSVTRSITVDENLPNDDNIAPFVTMAILLKTALAQQVIKELEKDTDFQKYKELSEKIK